MSTRVERGRRMFAKKRLRAAGVVGLDVLGEHVSRWRRPRMSIRSRHSRRKVSTTGENTTPPLVPPVVVLAERYLTRTIASLDRRHFDIVRSLEGGYFEVLPRAG